ncbi:hypothetical protein CI109_106386 [Kwoniella shandongensis]|uniref:Uncharacterized protein n=1 Tax=Kwoniella shandongensis TaxID=1734106 RepID=A0A5M6BSA1_9TREE|nr:uncharacterized protein CI109_005907 [Kwoniella shandongensis]KAA5525744.1 hypothetical protein CI109_005907 [Kwoniella shandongensis]
MKRLFRNSKTPIVDPLPPPPSTSSTPPSGSSTPHGINKSLSSFFNGGGAAGGGGGDADSTASHEHKWAMGAHRHHNEVTPFPVDVGRDQQQSAGMITHGGKGKKGKERNLSGGGAPPSMLEIQQQMRERDEAALRSQIPPPAQNGRRLSRAQAPNVMPDGRNAQPISINPSSFPPGNEYDPVYSSQPLPIPNASFAQSATSPSSASPSSAISAHTTLFLPPGARPPTPPSSHPSYPQSMRRSHSSLQATINAPYGTSVGNNNEVDMSRVGGRDRGYSSASAMSVSGNGSNRSEHDLGGSVHQHQLPAPPHSTVPLSPNNNLSLPPLPLQPSRSPLSNSYPIPEQITSFPAPRPYNYSGQPAVAPHSIDLSTNLYSPGEEMPASHQRSGEVDHSKEHGKEKKRFWGMGWGDKKGKGKDKDRDRKEDGQQQGDGWPRPSMDEPSVEGGWRETESQSTSAHGHSVSQHDHEDAPRGRLLGLSGVGGRRVSGAAVANHGDDVTSAIQLLCANYDPSTAAVYDVCDRINHSDSSEVSKEAVRAIRREFRDGNEAQRRNAAKVWLLLMRNVTVKGFRSSGANKKMVAVLESILFTPPNKPLVSEFTHRLFTDIIADLVFSYGMEKGTEPLVDLWKKVKTPDEPDFGTTLPADHPIFNPEPYPLPRAHNAYGSGPQSVANSRQASSPNLQHLSLNNGLPPPPMPHRGPSPNAFGPKYTDLPNHSDDVQRLLDECTAARESARVLSEALVYTRPEDLDQKPVIREFYTKVFHAHESLTNQMDWAQAEAARSRERHANLILDGGGTLETDTPHQSTPEELALASLFDAHSALAEALKQHDDLDRMAMDEREMREVRERSKKETRMDRMQQQGMLDSNGGLLAPSQQQTASSSRSPSPAPHTRLPMEPPYKVSSSPRQLDVPLAAPRPIDANHAHPPFRGAYTDRSRTPSPDRHPLPHPPKISSSPTGPTSGSRTNSPLGRVKMGPRPLPSPFKNGNQSQVSLATGTSGAGSNPPSRSGTGDTGTGAVAGPTVDLDEDGDHLPPAPLKPSRKALGKRRAVVDEDNNFDPNDMFSSNPGTDPRTRETGATANANANANTNTDSHSDSDESLTADVLIHHKPVVYAYDAYEERQRELKKQTEEAKRTGMGGSGGGGGSRGGMI